MRDLTDKSGQFLYLAACKHQLSKDRIVIRGIHEFGPAVLANANAWLRAFDAPAADALPCCYPLCHIE